MTIGEDEFLAKKDFYLDEIKKGKVFIYPTDTIYGIGCDATSSKAVKKIREIKERESKPFSVIAPNKDWIIENCDLNERTVGWLKKLPGPYTLILKLKNKDCIAKEVNGDAETIGVRIPNNWFSDIVKKVGKPFVTTSVNLSGEDYMTSLNNLKDKVRKSVDYIIYEGPKVGRPSRIVHLVGKERLIER